MVVWLAIVSRPHFRFWVFHSSSWCILPASQFAVIALCFSIFLFAGSVCRQAFLGGFGLPAF